MNIILITISNCYSQTNGKRQIDSMMTVLSKAGEDTNKVKILVDMSYKYGHIDNGLEYGMQAIKLSKTKKWKKGECLGYYACGRIYADIGDYPPAMDHFSKAFKIASELRNKNLIADNLTWIGLIYWAQGNYSSALDHYFKALKVYKDIGDKNGVVCVEDNIGVSYYMLGDKNKALSYHLGSLRISKEINNKHYIAANLLNIGIIYESNGDYVKALDNYFKSLKVSKDIGDKYEIGCAYGSIGHLYELLNDYPKAIANCNKALKIFEGYGYRFGITENLIWIGGIYLKQNKFREAWIHLNKAFIISEQLGSLERTRDVNKKLSELYEKTGDWEASMIHYKKFILARDSMINVEKNRKILQLEMNHKVEKMRDSLLAEQKLQTSVISNRDNNRNIVIGSISVLLILSGILLYYRNQRKKLLINKHVLEVEMKALRAQMNPHFIFNSLNSIYNFIQVNDNKTASTFIVKFSKLIRLILENSTHPLITLQEEITVLHLYLSLEVDRLQKKFSYRINLDEGLKPESVLIPPLIFQPYVENSIWHGMQNVEEDGLIEIDFRMAGDILHCTITDNGGGMQEDIPGDKKSLGTTITEQRLEVLNQLRQTKGSVTINNINEEDNKNTGVRVQLAIPVEMT